MKTVEPVLDAIHAVAKGGGRKLVGIAGPPGVGKSTLAALLCTRLDAAGYPAAVVPMDGFHLDNDELRRRGLLERKGAPDTFDADGFVALLERLRRNDGPVAVPLFDRDDDRVVPDAATVPESCAIVLVEGNYLLLDRPPWSRIPPLLDFTVFVTAAPQTLRARLIGRWLAHGHDARQAQARAERNDIPNAMLVLDHSRPADLTRVSDDDDFESADRARR